MSYSSQTGHFGARIQDAKGTFKTPTFFFKLTAGGLGSNSELLVPDPEIGGSRDIDEAAVGAISYGGTYEFNFRSEDLGILIYGALGAVTVSGLGNGAYKHTFTPANSLPWLSVEEKISDTYDTFNYTDARVSSLELNSDANAFLSGSCEMIAITQSGNAVAQTAAYDSSPILTSHTGYITLEGTQYYVRSCNFSFNNNLEDDDFRVGRRTLGDIPEHRRELSATLTIRPDDNALYAKAVYGEAAATIPTNNIYSGELIMQWDSGNTLIGASALPYKLKVSVTNAYFRPFTIEPSGDDIIEHDLELLPVALSGDIVTIELWNGISDYTA